MPQKILELKNLDWMKGISAQPNVPVGGLFQQFSGCDPFESGGVALPSLVPDNKTVGTTPKFLNSVINNANAAAINVLTNNKFYQVLQASPYTVSDLSSGLASALPGGSLTSVNGSAIYQGRFVYALGSSDGTAHYYIQANSVNGGSEVNIGSAVQPSGTTYFDNSSSAFTFRFCTGPDGNLYFNLPEGIGEITNVAGTSGNTNGVISTGKIDPGFIVRDLVTDGRYLIAIADNNAVIDANKVPGDFKCKVYFWDMVQSDGNGRIVCDAIWEIADSYLVGAKFLDGAIYIWGYKGLYVCNVATSPRMIQPYPLAVNPTNFGRPLNAYQIAASKGSLYWLDAVDTINHAIYAYGNPITGRQKIFYQPYIQSVADFLNTCLVSIGNQFVMGCNQPGLFFFNVSGNARGNVIVKSLDTNMEQPYTYDFTKVDLTQPLAVGQTVELVASSASGTNTVSNEIKNYNSAKPKQSLLFRRDVNGGSNLQEKFVDLTITAVASGGAVIQRIATYASPLEDGDESL
jgi:hypothetical protein